MINPEQRKRRKRDERLAGVSDRGLNDRDLAVLDAVYDFRVMSQPQLRRLVFGDKKSATVANRALVRLYDNQYLDRRILPVREGRGPNYYLLDRRGAEALRRELGYAWVKFYPSYKHLSDGAVRHLLAVGDFRILITDACRRLGLELEWLSEVKMRTPGGYDRVRLQGEPVGIIPDGAFCITSLQGDRSIFFLELDRISRQVSHFGHKIQMYLQYITEESYFQRFGRWLTAEKRAQHKASMRVLTVISSDGTRPDHGMHRLESLREEVEKIHAQKLHTPAFQPQRRFWFARIDDLTAENVLTHPVWRVRRGEDLNVLLWDFDPKNQNRVGLFPERAG